MRAGLRALLGEQPGFGLDRDAPADQPFSLERMFSVCLATSTGPVPRRDHGRERTTEVGKRGNDLPVGRR